MKLGNKLLLSFTVMLLLTMAIAFTGWRAMESMNNQTLVLSGVEVSVSRMLRAQVRQLLYGSTGDTEMAKSVITLLADAKKELADSRVRMISKERMDMADKGTAFLNWYEASFERLRSLNEQVRASDANMDKDNQGISDSFSQLVRNIESAIEKEYTSAGFAAMKSATRAQMGFAAARYAASEFSILPSPESSKIALAGLAEILKNCQETTTFLRQPANIQLAQDIVTRLKAYIANFENLSRATLDSVALAQGIRGQLLPSLENMQKLSASALQATRDAKNAGNTTAFLVTLCSLLIGFGIAVGINRNVGKQLGKDPADLNTIAQRVTDGDYNIDDGSPKVGVYGSLLHMVSSLHEHIDNATKESQRAHQETERAQEAVKEAKMASDMASQKAQAMLKAAEKLEEVAHIVSSASTHLAEQIAESEQGASEQAARVTETATAMAQMNSTVLEVARNAGVASGVSASTREKAEAGARVVLEAVHSIQDVQAQSAQLRTDMQLLDENARSISQIMGVISDIADQTNLLALNAAIEAARAGEAGRGFAVVADEVRKLAEKTMASTHDVGNAIRAIQDSATQSMAQVDRAGSSIEEATRFANESGMALKEIVSMVDDTADQVRAIAAASEEQSATSDEINRSIGEVNNIAAKTATAMEKAARAVSDLANQTYVLTGLIEDMKRG